LGTGGTYYPPDEASDERLIEQCRTGRRDAFETLVRRYEKPLYNYIRRMISNAPDAEDLFQETFLRVYKHLEKFRTDAVFRPWLYQIATNACRDHLRRRRRWPTVSLDAPGQTDGVALVDRTASPTANPSQLAGESELAERLGAAVDRLPVKHRAVFLMARYDGMPYDEIARALRIPVGTVKSRMNKAVRVLLTELEEVAP